MKTKNQTITLEEVKHVAQLANLSLSEEELEKFREQLGETIEYIKHLSEIATPSIQPTSQVTGTENIFREDEVKPSLSQKEVLANAKKTHKGYFVTK